MNENNSVTQTDCYFSPIFVTPFLPAFYRGRGTQMGGRRGLGLEAFELALICPFFFGLGCLEIQRAARHIEVLRLAFAG